MLNVDTAVETTREKGVKFWKIDATIKAPSFHFSSIPYSFSSNNTLYSIQ